MELLGATLQRVVSPRIRARLEAARDIHDPEYVERFLLELAPTEEITQRLEAVRAEIAALAEGTDETEPWSKPRRAAEKRLGVLVEDYALALQRDELQAGRPTGCRCLGLGGWGRAVLPHFEPHPETGALTNVGFPFWRSYCVCADGERVKAEHAEFVSAERARRKQERLARLFGAFPDDYQTLTLGTYQQRLKDTDIEPKDIVKRLLEWLKTDRWLYLWGPVGLGKTALGLSLLRYLIDQDQSGIHRSVPRLLQRIQATYTPSDGDVTEDVLGALYSVDVLMLDDLGKENLTPWARAQLFTLIDERSANRRRTIVTSNLSPWQLAGRMDDSAIPDRIRGKAGDEYVIEMRGGSLRGVA